jgi:UDP-N-acetylmuramate dehydrogenase
VNESPIIRDLRSIFRGEIRAGEPMSLHTSLRIGGPALALLIPEDVSDLVEATTCSRQLCVPYYIIGAGSNILVPDEGINGLVIKFGKSLGFIEFDGTKARAGAGAMLPTLAREATRRGLSGLEALAGIPGTVGGAVAMNAGAFSRSIAEVLVEIKALDENGAIHTYERDRLDMGYRRSALRGCFLPLSEKDGGSDSKKTSEADPTLICLEALFEFEPKDARMLIEEEEGYLRRRRKTQPLDLPTAGSVFKNPPGGVSAGKLIEQAGCKGLSVGGALVTPMHGNFIVNQGGATARDVLLLIDEVKRRVFSESGVDLELEIRVLGETAGLKRSGRRCSCNG